MASTRKSTDLGGEGLREIFRNRGKTGGRRITRGGRDRLYHRPPVDRWGEERGPGGYRPGKRRKGKKGSLGEALCDT